MDFRLTDEQTLMVDTARSLFTRECPTDVVRRVADEPAVASDLFDRHLREWVELAAGPSVDLCLFLVEAGAVVAPGPFLSTAGCFAPLLRAADHPLADDAVAGAVTGTVAVAAGPDGRLRATDLELVDKVALVVDGSRLAVVDASAVEARPVKTLDLARSMSFVTVPEELDFEPLDGGCPDRGLRAGRAGRRGGAGRRGPVVGRRDSRLRQGTGAVRRADRFVPGGAAQAGRLRARLRGGGRGRRRTRRCAWTPTIPTGPGRCTSPRPGPARRPGGRPRTPCRSTGASATRGSTTCTSGCAGPIADDALFGTGAWHLDQLADLLFA